LNDAFSSVSSYIREINEMLAHMANGDLRNTITREYIGQFASIKDSINIITSVLSDTMNEIMAASVQVLQCSEHLSESSSTLSHGASEQSVAVDELSETFGIISERTQSNADYTERAMQFTAESKNNAALGNNEMQKLLVAMDGIISSSTKINSIIKTIEDIAFQTNLLALNASVEAARAGEHGKGFSVVAEEVRNLAARSGNAAKETSELIQESINCVNDGFQRANDTAASLGKIVTNVDDVSDAIKNINDSSAGQIKAIEQVGNGLSQISNVVRENTASSEESAASAEELSCQAKMLEQRIAFFRTK
jgi:methyl-accepting chemotaxis protein